MTYRVSSLIKQLEKLGCTIKSQRGSHIVMIKSGISRPIILVKHNQTTTVSNIILKQICKQADININLITK